ncbi:MAG: hypothetical protein AAF483_16815, partial [Planctomycetota bacterium]
AFRGDGLPKLESLSESPEGVACHARLQAVYDAVGCGRRSDNMKDAFFIVRHPPFISAETAEGRAAAFVQQLFCLAPQLIPESGISIPAIRILEGKPPKHPKKTEEKSDLLKLVESKLPQAIETLFPVDSLGARLSQSLYFIACDSWLRDFLRWPLLPMETKEDLQLKSLDAYFQLWRHGIKFRIFQNDCIDFYLPHRTDGSLIDAGQFSQRQ